MLWQGQNKLRWLPGTAEAQMTALLLYAGALPVALSLTAVIDWRAIFIYTLMWPVALMTRGWQRSVLLLFLVPAVMAVLAQLVRPPQAPYFMLLVLILSVVEQVRDDGRPNAFNIIGVIFPALCVMVLSSNVFVFLLLLVSVIFYIGVFTLRINGMPLSGLRIRLLPIIVALSGSLFFAIAAFILMPRINPSAIPGFQQEQASSGVGDELDMGRFSDVILNGEDAFRAFVPAPLAPDQLYWRVHVLTNMNGAKWQRDPLANRPTGLPDFADRIGAVERPIDYTIRHAEAGAEWHPVLGVPLRSGIDSEARLNVQGEFVPARRLAVMTQQVNMQGALDNPFRVRLGGKTLVHGQPRLTAWAQAEYANAGSREAFIRRLLQQFRTGGFAYTLTPPRLDGPDVDKLDRFFFETRRGYCSHYAMTMAAALRAAGIPANVIIGYNGGEWNSFGRYYRIRQSDAHAWVEAEIEPGLWKRFDPTQSVPDAQAQFTTRQLALSSIETQQGWRGTLSRGLQRVDAFVTRLNSDIVLYDEAARRELLSGTVLGRLVSFVTFWIAATLAFIVPLMAWRWWLRRDAMLRLDQKFQALGRKWGIERPLHEGRKAYADRWQKAAPELAAPIHGFTDLFCEVLFSGRSFDKAELADIRRRLAQHLQVIAQAARRVRI